MINSTKIVVTLAPVHLLIIITFLLVSLLKTQEIERHRFLFQLACERFLVLMNNTLLIKEHRLSSMNQLLKYLHGMHLDVGMSGDRGDFYRRKLAEQIFLNFGISGVNHTNVMALVESAINLEKTTQRLMSEGALTRDAPGVGIGETILDIVARLADMY